MITWVVPLAVVPDTYKRRKPLHAGAGLPEELRVALSDDHLRLGWRGRVPGTVAGRQETQHGEEFSGSLLLRILTLN